VTVWARTRGSAQGDQHEARQGRANGTRAQASDPCWTRHHDEKYPNNVGYLIDEPRMPRKTSLMELKQLMVNEPLRAGGARVASPAARGRAMEGSGGCGPSPWKQTWPIRNPLMAKSSGTDHADAAIQSALRTLDAEGSGIAAITAALAVRSAGRPSSRPPDLIKNARGRLIVTRARQVRPYRPQGRGDVRLDRHPGVFRPLPRKRATATLRHDHRRRRHPGAVVVRRAAGDEESSSPYAKRFRISG